MELRPLGPTGVQVSTLALGTMMFGPWGNDDRDECVRMVHKALDSGINLVDSADVYGQGVSEEIVGKALADPGRRDRVVLATKFWNAMGDDPNERGGSRRWIRQAVEGSLRRLGTDRIDLYQMHRPDPVADIDETLGALSDLVHEGKVLAIGTSGFQAEQHVEARHVADARGYVRFATEQPPYSILARGIERAVLPTCVRLGIGVLVWSPLNGGWLTGKYRRGEAAAAGTRAETHPAYLDVADERKHDAVDALREIAAGAGISMTALALGWTLEHPAVTAAILGPKRPEQLDDLLTTVEIRLTPDVLDAIDSVVAPGVTLDPHDGGWENPALDPARRRRPR